MGMFNKLGAAFAIAIGAAFNEFGFAGRGKTGKHRTTTDTKFGRSMVRRRYRRSMTNVYARTYNSAREVLRRRRQIARGLLHPVFPANAR